MRLFRYLAKEVLVSTFGVTLILLLVILSSRFVSYLGLATEGKMTFGFLFTILGYHIPYFVQIILPIAFFLSLLLTFGRLYIENEMSVLFSSGISKFKLAGYTLGIAALVVAMSTVLNLWLTPTSEYHAEKAADEQGQLSTFSFLIPGRFQGNGQRITYIDSFTPKEGWMNDIFLSDFVRENGQAVPIQMFASYAEEIKMDSKGGQNYLVFKNGVRYEGIPGTGAYRVTTFDTYAMRMKSASKKSITDPTTRSTLYLLSSTELQDQAELQWRISLVIMIPILSIIGLSLSQVNPRQGRFFKMLPAILLMILYMALLIWGKTAIGKGKIPDYLGLWWIHGIFFSIASGLFIQYNQIFSLKSARLPASHNSEPKQ